MITRLFTAIARRLAPRARVNPGAVRRRANQAGLSIIETTIVLSVVMILTGVIAPVVVTLIAQAREFRVQQDCASRRHAINVRYLHTRDEVGVMSAGPNGEVETPFDGPGLRPEGADQFALVR